MESVSLLVKRIVFITLISSAKMIFKTDPCANSLIRVPFAMCYFT